MGRIIGLVVAAVQEVVAIEPQGKLSLQKGSHFKPNPKGM